MTITEEQVMSRKRALMDGAEHLRRQIEVMQKNLDATDGAIQDCDYWLNELDQTGEKQELADVVQIANK